jgi:hypothetical protein
VIGVLSNPVSEISHCQQQLEPVFVASDILECLEFQLRVLEITKKVEIVFH